MLLTPHHIGLWLAYVPPAVTPKTAGGVVQSILDRLTRAALQAPPECFAEGLRLAALYAVCSANWPVLRSERDFLSLVNGGGPMGQQDQTIQRSVPALRALSIPAAWEIRTAPAADAITMLVKAVPGLGAMKAAFALSMAGTHRLACIDIHGVRRYAPALGMDEPAMHRWLSNLGSRKHPGKAYMDIHDALYGAAVPDAAVTQWQEFWQAVPAFRESLHLPVVGTVLAAYQGQQRFPVTVPSRTADCQHNTGLLKRIKEV